MSLIKRHYRQVIWCCIAGYIIFILYVTLFSRESKDLFKYDFHPFWSYKAIIEGREDLLLENFLNVILFIPLGLLLWCVMKRKKWWEASAVGCVLSLCIEIAQLIMKRGFSELDDVIHNSLGTIIGYGLAAGLTMIVNKLICNRERRVKDFEYSQLEQE